MRLLTVEPDIQRIIAELHNGIKLVAPRDTMMFCCFGERTYGEMTWSFCCAGSNSEDDYIVLPSRYSPIGLLQSGRTLEQDQARVDGSRSAP